MPFYNQNVYLDSFRDQIDLEAEKDYPVFRYKDLKPSAREKFTKWIKKDSSIKTIRDRASLKDIGYMLKEFNPILIAPGWQGGFSNSTIYRWKEKIISSMIFNSLFRRAPSGSTGWGARYVLATPEDAMRRANVPFTCPECNMRLPWEYRHYTGSCNNCADNSNTVAYRPFNKYANRIIEHPPMSELWCGNRASLFRRLRYQLGIRVGNLRLRWRQPGLAGLRNKR